MPGLVQSVSPSSWLVANRGANITGINSNTLVPKQFNLEQNYPNPFNPSTQIAFTISKAGIYTLKVYNVLGQEVATLVNRNFSPGDYTETFNANRLSSGVYIYRLSGENVNLVKKMMFMK
jgi:hypothetical protein